MLYEFWIESAAGTYWFRRAVGCEPALRAIACQEADADLEFKKITDDMSRARHGSRVYFIRESKEMVPSNTPGVMHAPYMG